MPILDKDCDALIRDRNVGQQDVGQRVTKLKQGRDALIRERRVGQKDVRQQVPMLTSVNNGPLTAARIRDM